jgi:CheY-like chemotaxis protein
MRKKRILVIDDDPIMTGLLSEFIEELDCDVKAINDSRESMDVVRAWHPDLITLDLEMPHKDGVEVLMELRSCSEGEKTPVMVLSGSDRTVPGFLEKMMIRLSKPIGCDRFLKEAQAILEAGPRLCYQ